MIDTTIDVCGGVCKHTWSSFFILVLLVLLRRLPSSSSSSIPVISNSKKKKKKEKKRSNSKPISGLAVSVCKHTPKTMLPEAWNREWKDLFICASNYNTCRKMSKNVWSVVVRLMNIEDGSINIARVKQAICNSLNRQISRQANEQVMMM